VCNDVVRLETEGLVILGYGVVEAALQGEGISEVCVSAVVVWYYFDGLRELLYCIVKAVLLEESFSIKIMDDGVVSSDFEGMFKKGVVGFPIAELGAC